MATSNRIIALNLGTQTIGAAEFRETANGGLVLTGYRLTEISGDPAADATRAEQTKLAVGESLRALKFSGSRVNYAIPSQCVFTRFVKLPAVGEEKVDQIVAFEAQQNVPFPIDEVVWDYQLVGDKASSSVEVVLVAIKADLLEDLNNAVEKNRLTTAIVDVAPMALYNAFRYNYSDVVGCSLIIDIGSRTTNLIFIEPKKVFTRSITIAGSAITAAVAKEFDEPFAVAEARKKKDGFVNLGGAYAEPDDPNVARTSKMVRSTMTRLHSDISRSISFYRSQQNGSAPQRVYLAGGSASLPYIREFFSEKLQVPVEFLNPFRNVAVADGVDAKQLASAAHVLGELVGLGLRGASVCPMELNLQPASVAKSERMRKRQPALILALAALFLGLITGGIYFWKSAQIQQQVLESKVNPIVNRLHGFDSKMNAVRSKEKQAAETISTYVQAIRDRSYQVDLINDLNTRLPARHIWVTSFRAGVVEWTGNKSRFTPVLEGEQPLSGRSARGEKAVPCLELKGLHLGGQQVALSFLKNLAESPFFSVNLAEQGKYLPFNEPENPSVWATGYTLYLPLKAIGEK